MPEHVILAAWLVPANEWERKRSPLMRLTCTLYSHPTSNWPTSLVHFPMTCRCVSCALIMLCWKMKQPTRHDSNEITLNFLASNWLFNSAMFSRFDTDSFLLLLYDYCMYWLFCYFTLWFVESPNEFRIKYYAKNIIYGLVTSSKFNKNLYCSSSISLYCFLLNY